MRLPPMTIQDIREGARREFEAVRRRNRLRATPTTYAVVQRDRTGTETLSGYLPYQEAVLEAQAAVEASYALPASHPLRLAVVTLQSAAGRLAGPCWLIPGEVR